MVPSIENLIKQRNTVQHTDPVRRVGFVLLCFVDPHQDGTPVPKHVAVGIYYELYFAVCISLYITECICSSICWKVLTVSLVHTAKNNGKPSACCVIRTLPVVVNLFSVRCLTARTKELNRCNVFHYALSSPDY